LGSNGTAPADSQDKGVRTAQPREFSPKWLRALVFTPARVVFERFHYPPTPEKNQ